jgi:DNA-binding transcriptional ArsR family regulator
MSSPTTLFSKARLALLTSLFGPSDTPKHLRQIAREGNISPTAMARELEAFLAAGVLTEERLGNLRLFRANPASPLTPPLRQLTSALAQGPAISKATAARKSEQLGLTIPYDWSNPAIDDDVLISKAGAQLRFEDIATLCAHYGIERVQAVLNRSVTGDMERKILARQLGNIRASLTEESRIGA